MIKSLCEVGALFQGRAEIVVLMMVEYGASPSELAAGTRSGTRWPFLALESVYSVVLAARLTIRSQPPRPFWASSIRRSTTIPVGLPPWFCQVSFGALFATLTLSELGASGRTGQSK